MNTWSRRNFVGLAAAATAAACAPTGRYTKRSDSLDALAQRKGLRFGSEIGTFELADPRYRALVKAQCGVIVAGNELKWPQTQSGPDRFTFGPGDRIAAFAHRNNLQFRGHNLLWQKTQYLPDWVKAYDFGANPRATAEKLLDNHITTEMKHYPQIMSWDVINETIDENTGEIRDTLFTRYLGPDVVDFCYRTARAAAPDAQLVYNDYMSWYVSSAKHRAGVLRLLERARKNGTPIDALGIQSHIGVDDSPSSKHFGPYHERDWRNFLDEVTGMGFTLLITEFDVGDDGLPTAPAVRDKAIADYARAYLDLTLSYKQVKQVLCWGLVDKYSWLQHFTPRPDGTPKRPLPFDSDYKPKPLYDAIAAAFRAAPIR